MNNHAPTSHSAHMHNTALRCISYALLILLTAGAVGCDPAAWESAINSEADSDTADAAHDADNQPAEPNASSDETAPNTTNSAQHAANQTAPPPSTASSPTMAFLKAIMAANEGDFEKADKILHISWLNEKAEIREWWDQLTRDGTIQRASLRDTSVTDGVTHVTLDITYKDESMPLGLKIKQEGDRWIVVD